jgi:hypothetical protein
MRAPLGPRGFTRMADPILFARALFDGGQRSLYWLYDAPLPSHVLICWLASSSHSPQRSVRSRGARPRLAYPLRMPRACLRPTIMALMQNEFSSGVP